MCNEGYTLNVDSSSRRKRRRGHRVCARGVPAHYEYAPFGSITAATTNTAFIVFSVAVVNPFRFSSEYADNVLRLMCYNYRHYYPSFGRWKNRDPKQEGGGLNMYAFCINQLPNKFDLKGLGTWSFGTHSPWGDFPAFSVSYEIEDKEKECCKSAKVLRYVRKFVTGGDFGTYFLDGDDDQFVEGYPIAYAPDDWPEGPGIGFFGTPYYRISWRWEFKFIAECTKGAWAGRILSEVEKPYWAAGHKVGDDNIPHGIGNNPVNGPDLQTHFG